MRRLLAAVCFVPALALADEPRPPAELAQLKELVGVWKCEGKARMGGKESPTRAVYTVVPELDAFVYVGRLESPRTATAPAYRGRDIYGYDAGNKMFTAFSVDNTGAWGSMTSKGWEGDKLSWSGKTRVGAGELPVEQTLARKGADQLTITGSQGAGDNTFTWEANCRK